jgi:hypothetical protein
MSTIQQRIEKIEQEVLEIKKELTQPKTVGLSLGTFKNNKTESGWTLESHQLSTGELDLELCEITDDFISGDEMLKKAKKLDALLGQDVAEALLEKQELIPEEWRKYYLAFPGTVWRVSGGGRSVACLRWDGGSWYLYWRWLDYGFGSSVRLVRSRK